MTEQRKGQWEKCTEGEAIAAWYSNARCLPGMLYERFVPAPDERDAEIARLKAELAEARRHAERMSVAAGERIDDLKRVESLLAEAKKPVSVPGRPECLDEPWRLHDILCSDQIRELNAERIYALALESRVRELEARPWTGIATTASTGIVGGTSITMSSGVCAKVPTHPYAIDDTIARVTERATRIMVANLEKQSLIGFKADEKSDTSDETELWRGAYLVALAGEPAHAEAVAKIKAGGA